MDHAAIAAPALPGSWPRVLGRQAGLPECVALALLLHLLMIAIFGNTPGGSAKPGEGVWGSIDIRLAGPGPAREEAPAPPAPDAYSGPAGAANERRWGGRVRDASQPPAPADNAGAARLGTWNPAPTLRDADPLPAPAAPLPVTEPAPPSTADASPPAVLRELAPAPRVAPLAPLPTAPSPLPDVPKIASPPELAPLPRPVETKALAPPAPLPAERSRPLGRVAPVEPVALPQAPPELRPPAPTRTLAAPTALPTLPAPSAAPLGRVAPVEAVTLPSAPPELRPPPPVETRSLPAPAATPLPVDAAPLARPQPMEAPRLEAPPSLPELRAPAPAPAPAPAAPVAPAVAPAAAPSDLSTPNAGTGATPNAAPARAAEGLPRPAGGTPDAGAAIGHDIATPPSQPASAPRLNLDLARPRGGEISSQGSRGLVNLLPHPPERKSKLAEGLENAAKPDCRTAYSGMGLLAVVPLVADAVTKDGCRW